MLRLKALAVVCFVSFGSIALAGAAPTVMPAPPAPQVGPVAQVPASFVKMLVASEEASMKLDALAVASSVIVHSPQPPPKGAALPKRLTVELVLDGSKEGADVRKRVEQLQGLAVVDGSKKRPPLVTVVWDGGLPAFEGVIASISVKYTLFLPNGTPTRASVSMGLNEGQKCRRDGNCPTGQVCLAARCATPIPVPSPPSSAPTSPF